MTYTEILDEAFARVRDAGRNLPARLLLRQIGQHQALLYMRCAVWNPEYYGICVTATITGGGLDLHGLTPPLNQAAGIQRVEVYTTDSSPGAPAVGTRLSVVPLEDPQSGLSPRVTIRDNALRQVGVELAGVTALKLYYAKLPNPVLPDVGATAAELREPWQQLLVLNCANYIAALLVAEGRDVPAGLVALNQAEEATLLAAFEAHVRGYVTDVEDRFRRTGGAA